MKKNDQQNALIEELRRRLSNDKKLVDILIDTLCISKEAAYRRLRNEVPFTFQETAVLAKDFGISLDNLVGVQAQHSRPFLLKLPDFINTATEHKIMLDDFICFLKNIAEKPDTEVGILSNVLPQDIFSGFDYLLRFNVFKWQYYYHNDRVIPFHKLKVSPKALDSFNEYFKCYKHIKKTFYIFDNHIYRRIVDEIRYFRNIQLMNDEDVSLLKEDILKSLDYMEYVTIEGKFKETGNPVSLYITDIDITTSYNYLRSNEIKYTMIKTFLLTSATSLDSDTFDKMRDWMHATMKTSTLITQTNEGKRLQYFRQQREVIDQL